jgi:DNA mismatch repair protein MutS2
MKAMEKTRSSLREDVSRKNQKLQKEEAPQLRGRLTEKDLHIGDKVRVISMGLTGTVTELPRKGKVKVQCGIMNSQVKIDDLILIHEDAFGNTIAEQRGHKSTLKKAFANAQYQTPHEMNLDRAVSVQPEIMLLGMTTDEAIRELDKYLDDARMSHLESVRIVHGKGTGALRNAVQQDLRKQKGISWRSGDFGEGDAGVTIVQLKK